MKTHSKHLLIIAGEASGDSHGAGVVAGLLEQDPALHIAGIGGTQMESAGMELLYHVRDVSFMGFAEILRHLPFLKRMRDNLLEWVDQYHPEAIILIDYPGFNLRFAKKMRSRDIPVYYYISPQVWAWGKGRLSRMKESIRKMFVIFPFEEDLYHDHGVQAEFVGHPLVEEIRDLPSRETFFADQSLDPESLTIGLFPGSRRQEIERHIEVMVGGWEKLRSADPGSRQCCVAVAPDLDDAMLDPVRERGDMRLIRDNTHAVMKYCDVAVASSGTATLELAYFETPMVIIYRMNPVTYWIGKLLVDMPYIGLANIVAQRNVVPELIQHDATSDKIADNVERYLQNPEYREQVKCVLGEVRSKLGEPGAGRRVAQSVYMEVYHE